MTGEEYRAALHQIGMSQVGAARFFGVAPSTSRRWIAGQLVIPPAVAMLLCVMIAKRLSPRDVLAIEARPLRLAS